MSKKLLLVDPLTFLYTEVYTASASAGTVDAHKVVELNDQGFIDPSLLGPTGSVSISSISKTLGIADARKLIETGDDGLLDASFVAPVVGAGIYATAAVDIPANVFVHVYNYQGLKLAEPASAADILKPAFGFVTEAAPVGGTVHVRTKAVVQVPTGALTSSDLLQPVYLDPVNAGSFTTLAPGAPHLIQQLGVVDSVGNAYSTLYINIQMQAVSGGGGSGIANFTAVNNAGVLEFRDPSGSALAPIHVQGIQIGAFQAARTLSVPLGDGIATTFLVPHNLNNPLPMWTIVDFTTTPPEVVWPKVEFPDANHVRVSFGGIVPSVNQYGLTLIG
jgi:hypothetical protein